MANDVGNTASLRCSSRFSPASVGGQTITAAYGGDSIYSSSTGTFQLIVLHKGGDLPAGGGPLAGLLNLFGGLTSNLAASPFFGPSVFALTPSLLGLGVFGLGGASRLDRTRRR